MDNVTMAHLFNETADLMEISQEPSRSKGTAAAEDEQMAICGTPWLLSHSRS